MPRFVAIQLLLAALLVSACDEVRPAPAKGAPVESAIATKASSMALPASADAELLVIASRAIQAALTYASSCTVEGFDDFTSDRCYTRGHCAAFLMAKGSTRHTCGHTESQYRAVVATSEVLAGFDSKELSVVAAMYRQHAIEFGRFVRISARECGGQPDCIANTRGTLRLFQTTAKAFNSWQPERIVETDPIKFSYSGGTGFPLEGPIHWTLCLDGACIFTGGKKGYSNWW